MGDAEVADYCAWAVYRKWERGGERSLRIVADAGLDWTEVRLAVVECFNAERPAARAASSASRAGTLPWYERANIAVVRALVAVNR